MKRAEFSRRILIEYGGTYQDVNRLDEEGWESAADEHFTAWKAGRLPGIDREDEAAFSAFCYEIGRDFVLDHMGELFTLTEPDKAQEKRLRNNRDYKLRNIGNAALCIGAWVNEQEAGTQDAEPPTLDEIRRLSWALDALGSVCAWCKIELKEV